MSVVMIRYSEVHLVIRYRLRSPLTGLTAGLRKGRFASFLQTMASVKNENESTLKKEEVTFGIFRLVQLRTWL